MQGCLEKACPEFEPPKKERNKWIPWLDRYLLVEMKMGARKREEED